MAGVLEGTGSRRELSQGGEMSQMAPSSSCCPTQNVGTGERVGSILGGGLLALYGLRRGSLDGLVLAALGGGLVYRGVTGHCHMYGALGVSSNRDPQSVTAVPAQYGVKVEQSFTINRPARELYDYWRKLENLPRIMRHLKSVEETDGCHSHWVARGPMGTEVSWDAIIHNEDDGRMIAWRSLPGSQVETAGSVHFNERSNGRGTELRVSLKYNPPGGQIGATIASLLGSGAEQDIKEDLRRFKQMMETGEIVTTAGQPHGHCM